MKPSSHQGGKKSGKHDNNSRKTGKGSGKQKERSGRQGSGQDQGIRLNRYIANSGVCSRREADELILSGAIKLNGKTVKELGVRVNPSDSVSYNDKPLRGERKVYVLLNKPKDTVTTVKDTHGRKTVMDLVRGCCRERIYPVGRLDRNTTGILLFTNDGEMADALTHPSNNQKKIYQVQLNKTLDETDLKKIRVGFELEDGFIKPDRIEYVEDADRSQVGIEIHSGRNRIVRRIFERLDYKVLRLDRVFFAGLTKKGLSRGRWRHLTQKEVNMLKMSTPGVQSGKRPRRN